MYIEWIVGKESNHIYLSSKTIEEYEIDPKQISFHFGAWKQEVQIIVGEGLKQRSIGLPEAWKQKFTIPDTIPYELYKKGNDLHLGPVIAFIVFSKEKDITLKRLNRYRSYFHHYLKIKGLLYLCAGDKIDTDTKRIDGYYFDPHAHDKSNRWKVGTFPYPRSAYNRTSLRKTVFDDLFSEMGDRIFNSYSNGSFNKWELWQRLSPDPLLRSHLPHTVPLSSLHTLDEMINKYDSVYLKPAGGTLSKGIIKARRDGEGYCLIYPNRKKRGEGTVNKCIGPSGELATWILTLKEKEYLVQQAIAMKKYKDMPIDFRVIMQKNGKGQWKCTGIFGKFGKQGSIITNFTQSGFVLSGIDSFQLAFHMNKQEAQHKTQELKDISYQICSIFNKYGNYGDVGIDLMVDGQQKIWILEVNTLDTNHRFPLHTKNKKLYKRVVSTPLKYAKYLTGFTK